jgi:hypothetical protein
MPVLHDPAVARALRSRVEALRLDATRRWGKMTVDQMGFQSRLQAKHLDHHLKQFSA